MKTPNTRRRIIVALSSLALAAGFVAGGGAQATTLVNQTFTQTVPLPATPSASIQIGSTNIPVSSGTPADSIVITATGVAATTAAVGACPLGQSSVFGVSLVGASTTGSVITINQTSTPANPDFSQSLGQSQSGMNVLVCVG